MSYVASRLAAIKPSASMAASMAAKALAAKGIDVIDLGLGEPDFSTPTHIIDAAHEAARRGETRYTPANGTPQVRKAIIGKFLRENDLRAGDDEIALANGAKQIIFNALMATLEPGEEVILPAPYFVSYPEMVKLLGGVPVSVECGEGDGFRLTPEQLERAITPRTKWLFLNLPNNPSGASYDEAQLQALGEVVRKHPHVLILSDEIYEHILFDGRRFVSFAIACPDLRARTLIVNGVSKAYSMTGWRVGYAVGPAPLIKAMNIVQSQSCSSICSIAQAATVAALDGPQDHVAEFRAAFERRRDLVVEAVRGIDGLALAPPQGAFYAYINCAGAIGRTTPEGVRIDDDGALVRHLLERAHVSCVPGAAYGLSPFFRISTATGDDVLIEAMRRIGEAVSRLT